MAYGNGLSTAYTYSDAGDILTLNHATAGAPHFTYTYTPAHQLLTEAGTNANYIWQPSTATSDSYAAVNALNQYPSVNGGTAGGTDCQGHAQAMSYDCNGNLTGDGIWAYAYDPENHMMSASKSGTSASYAYDPLGRRETKTVGATVTTFLDDGDDEIAEYDGTGAVQRRFVPGPGINQPIAMVTGSGGSLARQYLRTNHQGSVIDSENDAGTRVEGPIRYDPFGNCLTAAQCNATTPYRFAGMRLDSETGLSYDRARMYSAALGRFPQTDPVGYASDLNLYTYVGNDPTDKTDPTGLQNSCGLDGLFGSCQHELGVVGDKHAGLPTSLSGDTSASHSVPITKIRQSPPGVPISTGDPYVDQTTIMLSKIAVSALDEAGEGMGPVFGTRAHFIFARMVSALGRPDLHVEQSFDLTGLVEYGLAGSIRTDVVLGTNVLQPTAIYDLKTGSAFMTHARAQSILDKFPTRVPQGVIVIHPQIQYRFVRYFD